MFVRQSITFWRYMSQRYSRPTIGLSRLQTAGSHLRDSLHKAIEIVELLNTSGVKSDAVDTTITTRRTELIEPRSPYVPESY